MDSNRSRISVIIPVYDDTAQLKSLLTQLREYSPSLEIVVADGGGSSETKEVCRAYGAKRVVSPRGRGIQMNRGASATTGDILWFLHADSVVHPNSLDMIEKVMRDDDTVGGAFRFRLHQRHWYAPLLDLGVRLRSHILKLPYGDQGFFVRRTVFESMAGYVDIPFLEDVEFIRRLRRYGEISLLSLPIGISSRRWEREGFFYVTIRNWLVTLAYLRGVSPERLVRWYRVESRPVAAEYRIVRREEGTEV
jgi:rSAM/selenodomain-associated transferase 2